MQIIFNKLKLAKTDRGVQGHAHYHFELLVLRIVPARMLIAVSHPKCNGEGYAWSFPEMKRTENQGLIARRSTGQWAEEFLSGDCVPENAEWVGLPQGEPTTW